MKIHNLINRRITKFCKRTMALTLAALFVVPSIMYSMSNGFSSVKAASSYETVGVGKKLVDCFPGEDRIFAQYVYEEVLKKGEWDPEEGEVYQLDDNDVQTIQNLKNIINFTNKNCSDITGVQNFTNLTLLWVTGNQLTSLPDLPTGLVNLYVDSNQLTSLPDLPDSLANLNISNNPFTSPLPKLPDSLTQLYAISSQLESLPELPSGLRILQLDANKLTSLPDLPDSLTQLQVGNNQLTSLPELPSGLTRLWAYNNQLKELDLSNMTNLSNVNTTGQTPQFEYIVTPDGNYKILDVPTKNVSDIMINDEAYNDYDNSGSITVSSEPTSFTYNYNTGYDDRMMDVTATLVESPLTSVTVKTPPTKTTYIEGNKFDPTGLIITLTYDNDTSEDVAYNDSTKDDFSFSPDLNTALQASHDKVTITYDGKTTEQSITVKVFNNTTLTNEGNGVTISGSLEENASLTVSEIDTSHDNYSSLLESLGDGKKVLLAVDVSIVNGTFKPGDNLTLTFEVDPIYNGRNATVKHLLSSGQIETYPAIVIDGKIQITVTELSPFMIAIDEDPVTDENNDYNADSDDYYASIYQTGDNAPISVLFAIIASSIMVISGYIIINRKKFLQK